MGNPDYNKWNNIIVVISVWLAALASLMPDGINRIALYFILPMGFILTYFRFRSLLVNKYLNILTILYLWITLSVIWATDTSVAFSQVNKIIGCYILCYIFCVKALNIKNIYWLYITYIILLGFAWYYAYNNIFSIIELGKERINDEKLNANTLAYYTFYFTFTIYILGETTNKLFWKKFLEIVFLLTIPLSVITAIYTASRQVLILQIPLSLTLLYIRYIKNTNIRVKLLTVLLATVSLMYTIPLYQEQYEDSLLKQRNEIEFEDESRIKLAHNALDIGLKNFPLGVGAGNFVLHSYDKHFSHNVYLELFANVGFIGLILYVSMILTFLKRQWNRYKYYKDNIYLSFFVFGVFYFIDGFFYSFYESLWLIAFFLLVASHSESYYDSEYDSEYEYIEDE